MKSFYVILMFVLFCVLIIIFKLVTTGNNGMSISVECIDVDCKVLNVKQGSKDVKHGIFRKFKIVPGQSQLSIETNTGTIVQNSYINDLPEYCIVSVKENRISCHR